MRTERKGDLSNGGGVAYGAHVIGFLFGAAVVWPLRNSGQRRELHPRWGPYRYSPR